MFDEKLYQIHQQDCIEFMRTLPAECVHLIFADPPYNIKIASWDRVENYFEWCGEWVKEASRILTPNGAFWVSHSEPEQLIMISQLIAKYGRKRINWITWDKWNGGKYDPKLRSVTWGAYWKMVNNPEFRSFPSVSEFLIFHADEGGWVRQCDESRGFIFESIRKYLDDERTRAGISTTTIHELWCKRQGTKGRMVGHWFGRSQWMLPTQENYEWLRSVLNPDGLRIYLRQEYESLRQEYESLRQEYESLRQEYESLRYTFNPIGHTTSVWQIPPGSSSWHPTPKSEALLYRILNVTSNPGDVVYEPFAGSAVGCKVSHKTGRKWFGTETNQEYVEKATRELTAMMSQLSLFTNEKAAEQAFAADSKGRREKSCCS